MAKRINWLDVSRGIAFLMVIYSHLIYCDSEVMKFFSPVFLTTFFFVSGYLFKENQSFMFVLENRTRTLLLPFLTLGGIMILLSQVLSFNEHIPIMDSIKGLLFQNGQNQLLWFVAALYVYSVIFFWVERYSGSPNRLLAVGAVLFVLNAAYSYWLKLPSIPWHVSSAGFACFYMALGKFYKHHEEEIDNAISTKMLIAMAIAYVVLIQSLGIKVSFAGSKYVVDALLITVIGLILCIRISKSLLVNDRFLLFVGSNTLFYFAFHGKVYSLLQTVTLKMIPTYEVGINKCYDMLTGGGTVLIDALILIIPAMLVNRYCPQVLGKGFKLWKVGNQNEVKLEAKNKI